MATVSRDSALDFLITALEGCDLVEVPNLVVSSSVGTLTFIDVQLVVSPRGGRPTNSDAQKLLTALGLAGASMEAVYERALRKALSETDSDGVVIVRPTEALPELKIEHTYDEQGPIAVFSVEP